MTKILKRSLWQKVPEMPLLLCESEAFCAAHGDTGEKRLFHEVNFGRSLQAIDTEIEGPIATVQREKKEAA